MSDYDDLAYKLRKPLSAYLMSYAALLDLGRGTAMPTTGHDGAAVQTDTRFFRTDLGWACYYDGTRWLSADMFTFQFPYTTYTVTTEDFAGLVKTPGDYAVWPVRWDWALNVNATNNGSNYWTVRLRAVGTNTVVSFNTSAMSASSQPTGAVTAGFAGLSTSDKYLNIRVETTGAPTPLDVYAQLRYRLIVT